MTTGPADEYERVRSKYAPMRASDMAVYVAGFVALLVAGLFREVSWPFYLGMGCGAAAWEVTKYRLRRNARHFAEL